MKKVKLRVFKNTLLGRASFPFARSYIFWDISPCSPLKVNRLFGGKCRLHLQCLTRIQARNQHEACSFDPEDGDEIFIIDVG
jgi:hypothetical protein